MTKGIIALYIRLSIEDEKYDSLSIENQQKLLREKAASLPEYAECEVREFIDMYNQRLIQCSAHGSVEKCLK